MKPATSAPKLEPNVSSYPPIPVPSLIERLAVIRVLIYTLVLLQASKGTSGEHFAVVVDAVPN